MFDPPEEEIAKAEERLCAKAQGVSSFKHPGGGWRFFFGDYLPANDPTKPWEYIVIVDINRWRLLIGHSRASIC